METKKKICVLRLEDHYYETYREAGTCLIFEEIPFEENYFHNAFYFKTLEDAKKAYDVLEKEEFIMSKGLKEYNHPEIKKMIN